MAFYDSFRERLSGFKPLTPAEVKKLAGAKLSDIVLQEIARSRVRVDELQKRYPSAGAKELAQHLIDGKKALAGMAGGISGVFGLISVPADMVFMSWLQIILLVDVATVYKANLKSERARSELLDLFGYANGLGSLQRSSPKVLGGLAARIAIKGGLPTLGRALPLVAAPITAYLNNQHIQSVGEQAVRFYEGFDKAHAKTRSREKKTG
ncbi:MAG TPA: hypothetical protein VK539_14215 [Myxococcaceae bacterium]|nr:hypothetical protein [Myxococcaceae bacterium]